jgi:cytochrome c-type biogenesis protein CcmH/NrfG
MSQLGLVYRSMVRMPEAEQAYREAIRLEPQEGVHHANLAGTLFELDRRGDALAAAREAIRLGYQSHWVYRQLGLRP